MASGIWASVSRLLGLGQQQPGQTPSPQRRGTGITTRTWGKGRSASPKPSPRPSPRPSTTPTAPTAPTANTAYAGDFTGKAKVAYAPAADGNPDPGEVVWAWVPFEEDHSQGKDRPVLIIAQHRDKLLGLMLTSKDHDRDAAQEARYGRSWLDIGSGPWDRENRPSEVRLDRVLQLDPQSVRREGATLPRPVFDQVASAVRKAKNW